MTQTATQLTYQQLDPLIHGDLAYSHYRDACAISFGPSSRCSSKAVYLRWLAERVEEFPDGNVLALLGDQVIGQLELQVPYGLSTGYINHFYVCAPWRRLGFGRRLHEFADRYFRSWEAATIELDVSPSNTAAIGFYRALGYRLIEVENLGDRTWRMERRLI